MFDDLPRNHFKAILADPPWRFRTWNDNPFVQRIHSVKGFSGAHYRTLSIEELCALPVAELAARDCSLFLWVTWPTLLDALQVIQSWGFNYKSCAFCWLKAHAGQLELFQDDLHDLMGTGYWTRANSEACLLATRGNPKRISRDVRQAIIEPRREHSRKPDCVYERIERLVSGPYLELFARRRRCGWYSWGNEVDKFGADYDGTDDFLRSIDACYAAIRERKAQGGPGWPQD